MKATKYQKKSLIGLEDLLRRRRSTLKKFISDRGISTYQSLSEICGRLGVKVPSVEAFETAVPSYVSNPAEGVVVVPPLDVVMESSGERQDLHDDFMSISPAVVLEEEEEQQPQAQEDLSVSNESDNSEFKSYRKRMKKAGV